MTRRVKLTLSCLLPLILTLISSASAGAATTDQLVMNAYRLIGRQQYSEAKAMLDKVLKVNPGSIDARRYRCHALLKLGRLSDARSDLKTLMGLTSPQASDYILEGDILYYEGRPASALKAYQESMQLAPGNSEAAVGAARSYCALGRTEKAARVCDKAAKSATSSKAKRQLREYATDYRGHNQVAAVYYGS